VLLSNANIDIVGQLGLKFVKASTGCHRRSNANNFGIVFCKFDQRVSKDFGYPGAWVY